MHVNKDMPVFHQNHPTKFPHTRVPFVCKECAHIKSSLSADYTRNRHMVRISLLVFIIQWVHIYLLVSGYTTGWILFSVLEASHGSIGEKLPYTWFTLPCEVQEPPVGAGDILMTLFLPTTFLRIPDSTGYTLACFPCPGLCKGR